MKVKYYIYNYVIGIFVESNVDVVDTLELNLPCHWTAPSKYCHILIYEPTASVLAYKEYEVF